MAQDVTEIERVPPRPIAVDPAAIEEEFVRIWRETAGVDYDASSVRLRVLNFVGVATTSGAEDRWEGVMESMPQRYPCRGILALLDPAASAVKASISAHCWTSVAGGRHVCSEEVLLRGGVDQGRAVASAVLALLLPEVPVDLWLIDTLALSSDLMDDVLEGADRLFVDSGLSPDAIATYRDVLAVEGDRDIIVRDLAWCRIVDWRTLAAQLFDREEALRELTRLQSIEIVGGSHRSSPEALLLAGWFVSRLGLSPADFAPAGGGFEAALYDGTRGIRLAVQPDAGAAALRSVRIKTEGAAFLLDVHEASGHMHVREEWPDGGPNRTVALRPLDDAAVLAEALDDVEDGSILRHAMRAVVAVAGAGDEVTRSPSERA